MLATNAPVSVSNTWVKVLSTQGFIVSNERVFVAWTPTVPAADVVGVVIEPKAQAETTEDGLWCRTGGEHIVAQVTAVEVT